MEDSNDDGLLYVTLRFFIWGFFGNTYSCFSAFDKSRTFVLSGGVTGCHCNESRRGEVNGRAQSVGRFLGNRRLVRVKSRSTKAYNCVTSR